VGAIGSLAISGGLGVASTSEPEQEGKLRTPSRPTAVRCVITGQTKSGKSVIESCRRLRISVRDYLAAILPGLANVPIQRVANLTPAAWAKKAHA
jgi:hypothetical protein